MPCLLLTGKFLKACTNFGREGRFHWTVDNVEHAGIIPVSGGLPLLVRSLTTFCLLDSRAATQRDLGKVEEWVTGTLRDSVRTDVLAKQEPLATVWAEV